MRVPRLRETAGAVTFDEESAILNHMIGTLEIDPSRGGSPRCIDLFHQVHSAYSKDLGDGSVDFFFEVDFPSVAAVGSAGDCLLFSALAGLHSSIYRHLGQILPGRLPVAEAQIAADELLHWHYRLRQVGEKLSAKTGMSENPPKSLH